jgi:hypothetical protein
MKKDRTEKIPFTKKSGAVAVPARLLILNNKQRHAVLATDALGQPYTSLVAFALTPDARGILFATPKETAKYKNILGNSNVSLMIDTRTNTLKGYMNAEAVTILGTAMPVRRDRRWKELAEVFIKKHPALSDFVRASSTALIYMTIKKAVHAGRFQTVSEWVPINNTRNVRSENSKFKNS